MDKRLEIDDLIKSLTKKMLNCDEETMKRQREAFEKAQNERRDPSGDISMLKSYISKIPVNDILNKTFEKFSCNKFNQELFDILNKWVPGDKGFFIYGNPGSGKTHLIKAIISRYCSERFKILFVTFAQMLDELRASIDDFEWIFSKYKMIDCLVLDDIGAEKYSEWGEEKLCQLLDYRIRNDKTTFLSSNLTGNDLSKKYHQRTIDRFYEIAIFYKLNAPSYRIFLQQENYRKLINE